jgi:uncharacterized protein YjbI with pentapeptide repeats
MASFDRTKFRGQADFNSSAFDYEAHFTSAVFSGRADFWGTQFGSLVMFNGAEFGAVVDFEHAKFADMAEFLWTRFKDEAYFKGNPFLDKADFSNARLHMSKYVRFEDVNLSEVSFLDTDVRKIEFVNCCFAEKQGEKNLLYDEVLLKKNADKSGIEKVELLYRRLKQRSKEEHNETMVSHWHTREKEMQRLIAGKTWWAAWVESPEKALATMFLNPSRDKTRGFFHRSFINAYWLSSGYGEDPKRAAWWLAILVVLAVVLTGLFGVKPIGYDDNPKNVIRYCEKVQEKPGVMPDKVSAGSIIVYTLEDLSFQRGVAYEPANTWGRFFRLVFRLLTLLQFTLFAFALRNRFRR